MPRTKGHLAGAESALTIAKCCVEFGISYLTLYAFSTENWNRPKSEVQFLMQHFRRFLVERRQELLEHDIRLKALGRTDELPAAIRRELAETEKHTRHCSTLVLSLAVNYGARSEIVDACRKLASMARAGELDPEDIDEGLVARSLYTAGLPDPDLLIRSGGEMRLSNFLLWQLSYAELYMTEVLWPNFGREEFLKALREYASRERRFGAAGRADEVRDTAR